MMHENLIFKDIVLEFLHHLLLIKIKRIFSFVLNQFYA